eukprot:3407680-Karenia_brevis.AAC.1
MQCHGAPSSELTAVAWAIAWAMQFMVRTAFAVQRLHFHYDCTLSGGVAFCLWQYRNEPLLSAIVQGTATLLQQ